MNVRKAYLRNVQADEALKEFRAKYLKLTNNDYESLMYYFNAIVKEHFNNLSDAQFEKEKDLLNIQLDSVEKLVEKRSL